MQNMKLYRLEFKHNERWVGLGSIELCGIPFVAFFVLQQWRHLKAPTGEWSGVHSRFWYTEEGWEDIGWRQFQRMRGNVETRLLTAERPAEIYFEDEYQVAVHPSLEFATETVSVVYLPRQEEAIA